MQKFVKCFPLIKAFGFKIHQSLPNAMFVSEVKESMVCLPVCH